MAYMEQAWVTIFQRGWEKQHYCRKTEVESAKMCWKVTVVKLCGVQKALVGKIYKACETVRFKAYGYSLDYLSAGTVSKIIEPIRCSRTSIVNNEFICISWSSLVLCLFYFCKN